MEAHGWEGVRRTYLLITLLTTLSASLIWGINTLFLLDAGLSNAEAFTANAAFTAGLVLFEVPTGVVADTRGRRSSFLLGTATLLVSTVLYLLMWQMASPFWGWIVASALIGLGFSFFSGAVEAWLVDALAATGYGGTLEAMFARAQVVSGTAMLVGSVAGGVIAQASSLAVPYLVRAALLAVTFTVAAAAMRDVGFAPRPGERAVGEVQRVLRESIAGGLGNRPVRWVMLEAPFLFGVGIYAFYAAQPYLLELYGDRSAYAVAGAAAAIVAAAQIGGGLLVPAVRRVFARRTHALIAAVVAAVIALLGLGLTDRFWLALALLVAWSLAGATSRPVRQAYLNGLIASDRRATVLSFDSLMGSAGGVVAQPGLGRLADASGYGASYVASAALTAVALPFLALARREGAVSDPIPDAAPVRPGGPPIPPEQVPADARSDAGPPGPA